MRVLLLLSWVIGVSSCATPGENSAGPEARHTEVVAADIDRVWAYVSSSHRAIDWSVYFHHITPLHGDDGAVGARRRCFRQPDEQGIRWDEEVLELVDTGPHRLRHMHVSALSGFSPSWANGMEYDVWQRVDVVDDTHTTVTFQTRPRGGAVAALAAALSFDEVQRVFGKNLDNLGRAIEQGDRYVRQHPWEPPEHDVATR